MGSERSDEVVRTTKLGWHILWTPTGLGNNSVKAIELWNLLRESDKNSDVYFPTYKDVSEEGKSVLVPIFLNYVFVRCRHHDGLEDLIRERSGIRMAFLKPVGMEYPFELTVEEMDELKENAEVMVADMVDSVTSGFAAGDTVQLRSTPGIIGKILYFLPPTRAMIETKMFNEMHPVQVKMSDLTRLY